MDTDSDYDEENDDTELISLLMNDRKQPTKSKQTQEFVNLSNVPMEVGHCGNDNLAQSNSPEELDGNLYDDHGNEIIREIDLITPADNNESTQTYNPGLNNLIVNCIQDETIKMRLFRLNEQLESNIKKCSIVAAEAKTTLAEKMSLIRECKKIEEKILKFSVEDAKLKKIKRRKGKDCAETGHNRHTYFCRFGIPYFKSKERYPAEYNRDLKEITCQNQIMLFKLPKTRRFLRKDAQILDSLILQQLKSKRIEQLKEYLKDLNRHFESNQENLENDDIYERKKKIYDAIIETSNVNHTNDTKDWNLKVDFQSLVCSDNSRFSAEDYERLWNLLANPALSREDFTPDETSHLKELVAQYGAQDWDKIAQLLGTNRSGFMCFTKYVSISKKGKHMPWSKEEDELLLKLGAKLQNVEKSGSFYHWWRHIRSHFPNRTYNQIHAHWSYVLAPTLKKGRFTDKEHETVQKLLTEGKSFSDIAKVIRTRSCVQIRAHYEHKISSAHIKSGPWTRDEEDALLEIIREHGDKNWVKISELMKTRSRTQCRLKYMQMKNNPTRSESVTPEPFRKGRWSEEENDLFAKLFAKYGRKWAEISREMKTRSRIQCSVKFMQDMKLRNRTS